MNYEFSKANHYRLMENFLDSRKNFIVLGLCGKIGSGCSTVADILQKSFEQLNMPLPTDRAADSIEKHEYRILYTYAKIHWRPFFCIKTSALITAHVLRYTENEFMNFLNRFLPNSLGLRNQTMLQHIVNNFFNAEMCFDLNALLQIDPVDIKNAWRWLTSEQYPVQNTDGQNVKFTLRNNENNISATDDQYSSDEYKDSKMEFHSSIESINFRYKENSAVCYFKIKDLYTLFQEYQERRLQKKGFDNPLIFCLLQQFIYDYLPSQAKRLWNNLVTIIPDVQVAALQQLGNNLRISGKPYSTDFVSEAYSTIVVDINAAIKLLNVSLALQKEWMVVKNPQQIAKRSLVVVDSIKNPFESMYLKDRYTNYYLLGIYTEDRIRWERLRREKLLSESQIKTIDIIEQNKEFKRTYKSVLRSVEIFSNSVPLGDIREKINKLIEGDKHLKLKGIENLQTIQNDLTNIQYIFPEDYTKLLKEIKKFLDENKSELENMHGELNWQQQCNLWMTQAEKIAEEVVELNNISKIVIDTIKIINRNQLLDELPFIMQNVAKCLENADIFINNETDSRHYFHIKRKMLRYVSLIMNPGLVLPSPVERCMQLAYTAKLNSGCISRQVGAVITDAEYHLISIGWNQQPEGQIPCSYRDLCSLYYHWSQEAYSDYECDDQDQIQRGIKAPVMDLLATPSCPLNLQGKLPVYCFKDIYNSIMGDDNQVHPRALHAEETAFLNLGQCSAQGGILFSTSSPCELCAKKAKYKGISKVYYIEPYAGISLKHVMNIGSKASRPEMLLFTGAIGRAYTQLYTPLLPKKDELTFWLGAKIDVNILDEIEEKIKRESLLLTKEGNCDDR